jgi:hypothetical protein
VSRQPPNTTTQNPDAAPSKPAPVVVTPSKPSPSLVRAAVAWLKKATGFGRKPNAEIKE